MEKAAITDFNVLTGFGLGLSTLEDNLLNNLTSIKTVDDFKVSSFPANKASIIKGLDSLNKKSKFIKLIEQLNIPNDILNNVTKIILASSKFEIDTLENNLRLKKCVPDNFGIKASLKNVKDALKIKNPAFSVSAACASSTYAIDIAFNLLQKNTKDSILIITADIVTPFVFSGFSSLMALDTIIARPFDKNRAGLSLGEGAAYAVIMNSKKAEKDKKEIFGLIHGTGTSCDANHATGPSRTGHGLSNSIKKALNSALIHPSQICAISAHGTGTVYNDSMELKAFKTIFSDPIPVYSIKGAIGHTLGACGLIEALLSIKNIKSGLIPKTVGLNEIDDEAKLWVYDSNVKINKNYILSTNSGFGGINSAIIISC